MLRRHGFLIGALALLALGEAGLIAGHDFSRGSHAVQIASVAVICLAVAVCWRRPVAAVLAMTAATLAVEVTMHPPQVFAVGIAILVLFFALGARSDWRGIAFAVAVFLPIGVAHDLRTVDYGMGATFADAIFFGVAIAAGRLVRARTMRGLRYAGEATEARAALGTERARIARELHDIVAHSVSVMVVQATSAGPRAADAESRESFAAIETAGRQALVELRRLLGVLRSEDGEATQLAPQPGLDELPTLVDQVRSVGQPVELVVTGDRRELPAGVELSAYRVVQEGLTNAVKHAAGARTTVSVRYGDRDLEVEVTDRGGAGGATTGSGRGLAGLRERVALYEGTLEAVPDGRGFRVRATLPVRA